MLEHADKTVSVGLITFQTDVVYHQTLQSKAKTCSEVYLHIISLFCGNHQYQYFRPVYLCHWIVACDQIQPNVQRLHVT